MSLANDFHMYYNGTYIGYRRGENCLPFYVDSVRFDIDEDELYDNYDEQEHYYHLIFYGTLVLSPDGQGVRESFHYSDPCLILELPDLGYYNHRGRLKWVTLVPQRSVKKGLNERRLSVKNLTAREIYSIFNPSTANSLGRISDDFARIDGHIFYKGVQVGRINEDDSISLLEEASYLMNILRKKVDVEVNIEDSDNADS